MAQGIASKGLDTQAWKLLKMRLKLLHVDNRHKMSDLRRDRQAASAVALSS